MPGTVYDSFAKSQNADGEKLRIHLSDERKSWLGGGREEGRGGTHGGRQPSAVTSSQNPL